MSTSQGIHWKRERLIPLGEAAREVGVNRNRIYAWCRAGLKGVRLEVLCKGGRMHTSEEALQRFFERVTEEMAPDLREVIQKVRKGAKGKEEGRLERAMKELERMGI